MDKFSKFGARWEHFLFPVPARRCVCQVPSSPPSSPFLRVRIKFLLHNPGSYLFITLYVHLGVLAVERSWIQYIKYNLVEKFVADQSHSTRLIKWYHSARYTHLRLSEQVRRIPTMYWG